MTSTHLENMKETHFLLDLEINTPKIFSGDHFHKHLSQFEFYSKKLMKLKLQADHKRVLKT